MKLMNVRGTFDYLPKDMIIRNKITDVLRKNFEKYGYLPIETPMLNYYDLLSYKYSDDAEILSEVYKLTDQGNRNLGLRYDLTVPFCKVVGLTKDLTLPFRRYEIGKVFRNGPIKAGRTREFYQCDIDVVGIDNRYIEAEQMYMAINTFKDLGIDVNCKYNNRKLMSGLILESGISEDKIEKVISIIDKKEKVSSEALIDMLESAEINTSSINKLLDLFNKDIEYFQNIENKNELLLEGINELIEINEYIDSLGIKDNCIFTPTLARGLSIYTGIVFEFFDKKERITSAIGGGGRYNKIITNFMDNGNLYPAVGLSFGLEPIFVLLKEEYKNISPIDVYMVPLNTNIETLKLASELRNNNVKVLIEMNKKKISKCFEFAERENFKYVMIIGEDEINSNTFKIKDMTKKEEYSLSKEELLKLLTNK